MTFSSRYLFHKNSAKRSFKRRNSPLKSTRRRNVVTHKEQQKPELKIENPTHFMDLPIDILIDILTRLPLQWVSICRCVCRFWTLLIAKPDFNTMFLRRVSPQIFIRNDSFKLTARTLFLVDFASVIYSNPLGCHLRRETDVETKFYLPGRHRKVDTSLCNREFEIVNTCNGFLCLRKNVNKSPCLVVNPITGEFVELPKLRGDHILSSPIASGLGYSSRNNEYKVVCLFGPVSNKVAHAYTLGTGSYRTVGLEPWDINIMVDKFAAFLNGAIHWISWDYVLAFDVEDEKFRKIQLPTEFGKERTNLDIGVLGGCFFVSEITSGIYYDIWVMDEYGVHGSWNKKFRIDTFAGLPFRPLKFLQDGDLVLCNKISLDSYNPVTRTSRKFEIHSPILTIFESITVVPNFASLRYAAHGENLNVRHVEPLEFDEEIEAVDGLFLNEFGYVTLEELFVP